MSFVHKQVSLPKLESITAADGGRVYVTPEGNKYPSITTVLQVLSRRDIKRWRNRVGVNEANKISSKAATRGTALHTLVEKYLQNREIKETINFKVIKKYLDRIGPVYAQETNLWSDFYQVAGCTDCVANFDGEPSIIDFKTSKTIKPIEWIEHYFIQTAFYAEAWEERTEVQIGNLVIIMAGDDGTHKAYIEPKEPYLDKLLTVIDLFNNEVR